MTEKSLEDKFIDALDSYPCDDCGKYKDDVDYTTCPFAAEILNEEVWMYLCADCYSERAMDI